MAKVIDFGVAKAVGPRLTDRTVYTRFLQLVGSPLYMSPEQAGLSGLDVDTRADIYALGVLPVRTADRDDAVRPGPVRTAGYDEVRQIIRGGAAPAEHPPEHPGPGGGDGLGQPGSEPRKIVRPVPQGAGLGGDEGLEKDRNRRYETAAAFASDVQRYMADGPVRACPPSAVYRVRKFARRNRRAVATGAVVCLAVLLAVGGLAVSYARVREALSFEKQVVEFEKQVVEREQQALYLQRIKTAARELAAGSAGSVGRAERSLDDCPATRRGWEWHYLKRRRYQEPLVHSTLDAALTVAYSPDRRYLATACADGSVAVWDTRTWKRWTSRANWGHVSPWHSPPTGHTWPVAGATKRFSSGT